ncbi:MAG: HAMP domain-containing histidine kinase [Candidatus Krumholzibacteriota bacterium]|nr:HAMP domain-containing histidine kinase [Candidatus Krumholzibacteriota bacterium]
MTFRTRLMALFLLAVIIPMIVLAFFIRLEMTKRLTAQYERRVESLVRVIEEDLRQESETIASSLGILRRTVVDDNRFRRATVDRDPEERRYLLDYAGNAMRLAGLSLLQIQDETGRIISSGHFRNEYDRIDKELPRWLASTAEGTALVRARAPDAPFLALARVDSFQMGGRRYTLVAGRKVEKLFLARLAREAELSVSLVYPGGVLTAAEEGSLAAGDGSRSEPGERDAREGSIPGGNGPPRRGEEAGPDRSRAIVRELQVPYIDSPGGEYSRARFRVTHPLAPLEELRGSIDRWFLIVVAAAGILALFVVGWLASRISRPLVELSDKTSRIDLERLDIDFETDRRDEIGSLSRLLGAMTERLRAGAVRIREAEHRAARGELARQVNHDIKNGLTPIRNIFRHLAELARQDPERMPEVFRERQGNIDSSISYLENLAANYARLYPRGESRSCAVDEIIRRVASDLRDAGGASLRLNLEEGAVVRGDPLSLRRVLENLVKNALDSLAGGRGEVTVSTRIHRDEKGASRVGIYVSDTGAGMNEKERAKIFDDFYTTKEDGVGLGLSIVKRLVIDLGGSIEVESEEGRGSRFLVELPGEEGG